MYIERDPTSDTHTHALAAIRMDEASTCLYIAKCVECTQSQRLASALSH